MVKFEKENRQNHVKVLINPKIKNFSYCYSQVHLIEFLSSSKSSAKKGFS